MNPFRRKNRAEGASEISSTSDEGNVPTAYTLEPKSSAAVELINNGNGALKVQEGKSRPEFELHSDGSSPAVAVVKEKPATEKSVASVQPAIQSVAATPAKPVAPSVTSEPGQVAKSEPAKPSPAQVAPALDDNPNGISATSRPRRLSADVKPVISVRGVKKIYQMGDIEVQALRGVDLDIYPGEIMAIMGPSGSGKSTLMNVLGCLDVPSDGTYLLDGVDVRKLSDNQLAVIRSRKIGFVFQSYNLLSRTSAQANVELPLLYSGIGSRERRQRSKESLTLVGLGERIDHRPNELSGGQQQRVAIARALINRPAMILADEPTGNLDSKTRVEIMKLFQRLNRDQGITIVFVTHDPETADYCERVVWIRDGVIARDDRHKIVAGIYADENGPSGHMDSEPVVLQEAEEAMNVPHIESIPAKAEAVELPIL